MQPARELHFTLPSDSYLSEDKLPILCIIYQAWALLSAPAGLGDEEMNWWVTQVLTLWVIVHWAT